MEAYVMIGSARGIKESPSRLAVVFIHRLFLTFTINISFFSFVNYTRIMSYDTVTLLQYIYMNILSWARRDMGKGMG